MKIRLSKCSPRPGYRLETSRRRCCRTSGSLVENGIACKVSETLFFSLLFSSLPLLFAALLIINRFYVFIIIFMNTLCVLKHIFAISEIPQVSPLIYCFLGEKVKVAKFQKFQLKQRGSRKMQGQIVYWSLSFTAHFHFFLLLTDRSLSPSTFTFQMFIQAKGKMV